jgi:tetratricopeptide (TPR) repeat protein
MGLTLADSYYLKAKAATSGFCSDWGEVCEALNYALSYDENHCASLCFLGKIYAENLSQYTNAFECFDKVIAFDTNFIDVYPMYVKYLIWADEIERAEKLIDFAETIKAIDNSQLFWLKAYIEDVRGNYKLSLKLLKKAKINIYNEYYFDFMDDEKRRIKKKIAIL